MMNFTATRLSAEDSKQYGAVIEVTSVDNLLNIAMSYANIIAKKMSVGLRMAKSTLNQIEWMDLKNAYKFEQTQTEILQSTDAAIAAKRAFLENTNNKLKDKKK
jgi:enoyl-CoA hydratase